MDASIDTLYTKYPILSNESKCLFEFTVFVSDTDAANPEVPLVKIDVVSPGYGYGDVKMLSNDSVSRAFYKVVMEVDIGTVSAEIEGYHPIDPLILKKTTINFECEAIDTNSLTVNIIGKMDIGDNEYYHSTIEIDGLKYPIDMITSNNGKILNHISANYYLFGFKKSEFVHSLPNQWDVDIIFPNNENLTVSGIPYYPSLQTTQNDIELITYPSNIAFDFYETGSNYSALYSFSLNATYMESLGYNYPMFTMSSGSKFFSPRVSHSSDDRIHFIGAFKYQITATQTDYELFYQKTGGSINYTDYDISATYKQKDYLFTFVTPQVNYDYTNEELEKQSFTITFPGCENYDFNEIQIKYTSLEKLIKFPFGFVSGDNNEYDMEITLGINAGGTEVPDAMFRVYPNGLEFNSASAQINGNEGLSYSPAEIDNIEFYQLDSFMYLIQMDIYNWWGTDMIYIFSSDGTYQEYNAHGSKIGSDGKNEIFELIYNVLKFGTVDFIRVKSDTGGITDFKIGQHISLDNSLSTVKVPNQNINSTIFDLYSIYGISYSSNDIDVTDKSVGIKMTFNFSTFDNTCLDWMYCVPPMGLQLLGPSFVVANSNYSYYPIRFNETIELFYVDFQLKANSVPGIIPWKILINSNGLEIKNTNVGDNYQLRVLKSSTIDVSGPIITEINKTSDYDISKSICWSIRIVDEVNGFDKGEITIVGNTDNSIYKFKISPKINPFLLSGDKFNGVYAINVSLANEFGGYCITQTYSIFSVELYDTQGNPSKFSKFSSGLIEHSLTDATLNPFINFLNDTSIIDLEYDCGFGTVDETGPLLTFFNISNENFDTGMAPAIDAVKFTFTAKDTQSGLKNNPQFQQPIVYITTNNLEVLECSSKIVASRANGEVDYECTIEYIPRGFGENVGGVFVSVYGFINNGGIYSGYSSQMLQSMGFPYFIFTYMSTGYPVIHGTGEITSTGGTLWLYGYGLGRRGYVAIFYEDENYLIEHSFNMSSKGLSNAASVDGIKETLLPFTITFHEELMAQTLMINENKHFLTADYRSSNTYKVIPVDYGLSSLVEPSESSSKSISEETSSSASSSASSSKVSSISSSEVQIQCPGEPECGGNQKGVCLSTGICQCKEPWSGVKCDSRVVLIPKSNFNSTHPTVEILIPDGDVDENGDIIQSTINQDIKIKSIVSLISIRELDFKNTVIKTFIFDHWTFKLVNDQVAKYFTNISNTVEVLRSVNLNGGGGNLKSLQLEETIYTNINVTMEWFNKTSVVEFAESNLTMSPSSVKYSIDISRYPFASPLNHLQLVMVTSLESNEEDVCSTTEFGDSNAGDNANYGKLQIDQHSLNGRYIKRATIDSQTVSIENQELKQDDTVPGDVKTGTKDVIDIERKSNHQYNFIGINVPHFDDSASLDPDFSVLLSSSPDSDDENSICSSSKKGLTSSQLAGIIIGSIGFAAVVAVSVAYYFHKKKQQKSFMSGFQNKLKAMN